MTVGFDLGIDIGMGTQLDQRNAAHPNPMFDYLTGFIPRKLKDLFKWAEYLSVNSAHLYAIIKKFGEYPITEIQYETQSEQLRKDRKDLYETHLRLRGLATEVSFDKFVYGNSLISMYKPFSRFLTCTHCKDAFNIKHVDYRFSLEKLTFSFECPKCKAQSISEAKDRKIQDPKLLRIRRWDPKMIDIDYNPISGECVYYYTIPRHIVSQVRDGSRVMIDDMPMEFLEAMQQNRAFRFAPGAIYHLRVPGAAGTDTQWGLPPILAAMKLFLFAAILRKANEAIALDHVNPFRVLFPQAASGNGDPVSTLNLAKWKEQVQENFRRFRRDPLHIFVAPVPLGYQSIGGEGRTLLTISEIQEAEKNIALSMGVPMEFLAGGLGQIRGEVTLRMLENQLQTHIEDLNGLLQWVEDETARFTQQTPIKVKFADFKMLDDDMRQQFILQLWQQQKVSDTTVNKLFGVDSDFERKQRREDALADMRGQMETDREVQKLQTSLSQQAQQQAASAQMGGLGYDQQAVIAQADQTVQQLAGLDEGSRRSQLDALQGEDLVMYAVVKERLQQLQQNQTQAMKAQAQGAIQ